MCSIPGKLAAEGLFRGCRISTMHEVGQRTCTQLSHLSHLILLPLFCSFPTLGRTEVSNGRHPRLVALAVASQLQLPHRLRPRFVHVALSWNCVPKLLCVFCVPVGTSPCEDAGEAALGWLPRLGSSEVLGCFWAQIRDAFATSSFA